MLQPFQGHPSAALYKQPVKTSPGMQTVTLPSLGQAGYLVSLKFSSGEGREILLSLRGRGTGGGMECVCVCVCVYTYRCIIDADYSTGRTPYSLEIESSRKTNILCCMLISHN